MIVCVLKTAVGASKSASRNTPSENHHGDRDNREPVIATKSNRKIQRPVCRQTYAHRNLIERFFNKITHSRRVATRYDKLASSFLGFVQLADPYLDQVRPHNLASWTPSS